MKRHRTVLILACAVLAFAAPAFAQPDPFSKYVFGVREHRQSPEILAFAKACGITAPSPAQQRFAIGRDGWHPAKDLPKQVDKADSDFLATAEIWLVDGNARMVITWSTNAEGAQEQLSCMDSAGKVTAQQINSWSTEGSGFDEITITRGLNHEGHLAWKSAELIPNHGQQRPMTEQALEKDIYAYAAKYPDNHSLSDFQFPSVLFKPEKR